MVAEWASKVKNGLAKTLHEWQLVWRAGHAKLALGLCAARADGGRRSRLVFAGVPADGLNEAHQLLVRVPRNIYGHSLEQVLLLHCATSGR